jgi:hypothetical protein
MKPLPSLAFLAASAGTALGQTSVDLSVRFYDAGTSSWSSHISVLPGSTVQVGIWMSGDASIYGMGGATLRMRVLGAEHGDQMVFAAGTATGRVGPFNFGAATNAIYRDDPTTFRIDAASDAADASETAGLTFLQRDPATAVPGTFSTENPALVFRFDYIVGGDSYLGGQAFVLDQLSRGVAGHYTAGNSSRVTTTSNVTLHAGIINPRPTPGPLAAFAAFAGLAHARRRRTPR